MAGVTRIIVGKQADAFAAVVGPGEPVGLAEGREGLAVGAVEETT